MLPRPINQTPTEAAEQRVLVQYLQLKGLPHFRVPNETYTKSRWQKVNNKLLGVSRGVPDIFIVVGDKLIAIEMKRAKGSRTTPEQLEWIATLNKCGIPAKVCYGAAEAIEFINTN